MLKTCIRAALCNSFKDQVQGLSKSMEGLLLSQLFLKFPFQGNLTKTQPNGNDFHQQRDFHMSANSSIKFQPPSNWLKYNELVFPPREDDEPCRPAEIFHQRAHVKYQFDKMNYLCRMVRGMSVDEARKQLTFRNRAGATILKELIEEAQDMAVKDHNVEFKSNLWVAEAFVTPAGFFKGIRKHAKTYSGIVHYRFIHLFIKLREGPPPEHYYTPELNGYELKEQYLSRLRNRKIVNSL